MEELTKELVDRYGLGCNINTLLADMDDGDLVIDARGEHLSVGEHEFDWVPAFKRTTNTLRTIVANPKIHLRVEKAILNAEIASKVDTVGLQMTIRTPQFWRRKDNEYSPESVYANVFEDEIAIYENRFILLLIDKMSNFIYRRITYLYDKVGCLNRMVSHKTPDVGDVENIMEYGSFYEILTETDGNASLALVPETARKNVLTTNRSGFIDLVRQLIVLRQKLAQLKMSDFYKACAKARRLTDTEVHPTNILTMNAEYKVCYDFYRYLIKYTADGLDRAIADTDYQNFVLLSLLHTFHKLGYKCDTGNAYISIRDGRCHVEDVVVRRGEISFTLSAKQQNAIVVEAEVSTQMGEFDRAKNLRKKRLSRFVLDLIADPQQVYTADDQIKKSFAKRFRERLGEGFDNCYIFTTWDRMPANNVVYLVPETVRLDNNLMSLVKSWTTFLEGDSFIYAKRCPVCGSSMLTFNDVNYECLDCNSLYSMFTVDVDGAKGELPPLEMIWLKRFQTAELAN